MDGQQHLFGDEPRRNRTLTRKEFLGRALKLGAALGGLVAAPAVADVLVSSPAEARQRRRHVHHHSNANGCEEECPPPSGPGVLINNHTGGAFNGSPTTTTTSPG